MITFNRIIRGDGVIDLRGGQENYSFAELISQKKIEICGSFDSKSRYHPYNNVFYRVRSFRVQAAVCC